MGMVRLVGDGSAEGALTNEKMGVSDGWACRGGLTVVVAMMAVELTVKTERYILTLRRPRDKGFGCSKTVFQVCVQIFLFFFCG